MLDYFYFYLEVFHFNWGFMTLIPALVLLATLMWLLIQSNFVVLIGLSFFCLFCQLLCNFELSIFSNFQDLYIYNSRSKSSQGAELLVLNLGQVSRDIRDVFYFVTPELPDNLNSWEQHSRSKISLNWTFCRHWTYLKKTSRAIF